MTNKLFVTKIQCSKVRFDDPINKNKSISRIMYMPYILNESVSNKFLVLNLHEPVFTCHVGYHAYTVISVDVTC